LTVPAKAPRPDPEVVSVELIQPIHWPQVRAVCRYVVAGLWVLCLLVVLVLTLLFIASLGKLDSGVQALDSLVGIVAAYAGMRCVEKAASWSGLWQRP
jgi:hypothetical protein